MESDARSKRNAQKISPGSQGLDFIRRYAVGEELSKPEMDRARAAMYLIAQFLYPARAWSEFKWRGAEHFLEEIWPEVRDRREIMHGLFGDGATAP